ncbi:right-handed parallel beta-helix repeat-containing protein [uncultured Thiothrix sp.]|uniref:right-handed parallel beta-helix repeat-containing protein n=1 Tax=uncultured Thiothrix sp. TaxID=223185 RepID=UPI002637F434|nr:right-handed parallel beta-helix repeat-containing protein [uncultured Thiothrix sp.]HMT94994.1 right-handed parallel beta-helix repeat-containing protein [Thiolinea sp.]
MNGSILTSTGHESAIFVTADASTTTSYITVKNGTIQGYGTAVFVHCAINSAELAALKNDPEGVYPSIQATAPYHITFENIDIQQPKGTGFYVWVGASYVTINNCSVDGARGLGVYLDTGSHHNIVSNSTFTNGGFLNPDGTAKTGRGRREAIAVDGSDENTIVGNTITGNAYGGIHLYSNCGEYVSTDPTYIPRIFDAEYNVIDGNTISNNGTSGGAVAIGKRVDWNLESWDCAKPLYQQYLSFKYYWDNSGFNTVKNNTGNGDIFVRTDNNTLTNNQQAVTVNSVVRTLAGDPLVNNQVTP